MMFMQWWQALNVALAVRGEPEALWGEAHAWWQWRPIKFVDDRLVNKLINSRQPL
jgi:hypothetical protein